jgi:predicted Zn-dependent protease
VAIIGYSPEARNRKVPVEKRSGKFYNQFMWLMRFISIFLVFALFLGCGKFPFSNRYESPPPSAEYSADAIPFEQEAALGEEAFSEILKKEKLSLDGQLITLVERVGRQLAAVSPMPSLKWEFKLIASNQKNLIALPGGKVAVYTGVLPVCANEAGLAALMSHQIAHDIARHRAERLSVAMNTGGQPTATPVDLSNSKNKNALLTALGMGTAGDGIGPFNPGHEFKADEIGILLMVKAGYDPGEAERFWSRVNTMQKGSRPPELLSLHPIDPERMLTIRQQLPKAYRAYRANPLKHGLGQSFLYILSRRKMQEMNNKILPPPMVDPEY